MSLADHKGAAFAFRTWMQQSAEEITRGERKGATVLYRKANPARVVIGWMKRRVIRGEFRRRA